MSHKMTLADCVRLAEFAHFHQRDKAGDDYIRHPKRVLEAVQAQGARPYVQMAAVLHDVTEDTPFTPEMLLDLGVPEAAVEIVKLVDRDYSAQLWWNVTIMPPSKPELVKSIQDQFYYDNIKRNPGAVMVKLADIGDNTQPWRLAYLPPETQERLRIKYQKAVEILTGVLS